jgi:acyl-CoA synthetase (AMP-forming)/AMP-acid ligase II
LDLSRWTVAFNGAEPVRPETLDRFAQTFADCGFRREAFRPCYGLAESTLMVSGGDHGTVPEVRSFNTAALEQNQIVEAASGRPARALAGSGKMARDLRIAVVDPDTLEECAPERIGEIWVAGRSVAQGYWNRPDETRQTFRAHLAGTGKDRSFEQAIWGSNGTANSL